MGFQVLGISGSRERGILGSAIVCLWYCRIVGIGIEIGIGDQHGNWDGVLDRDWDVNWTWDRDRGQGVVEHDSIKLSPSTVGRSIVGRRPLAMDSRQLIFGR